MAISNKELDWHIVDDEFNEYAGEVLDSVDMLLFGRVTYQLMASYWLTLAARTDDPVIAEKMNRLPKVVFSKTLTKTEWNNTRLVKENIEEEIDKLKRQPGKNLVIFGSSDLTLSLSESGLIDEYRLFVIPVFLGSGKPLLHGLKGRLHMKLLSTRNSSRALCCFATNRRINNAALNHSAVQNTKEAYHASDSFFLFHHPDRRSPPLCRSETEQFSCRALDQHQGAS